MRTPCLLGFLIIAMTSWASAADEAAPKIVTIRMTFDQPTALLGGTATGHITLTDADGNPASLDDDLTVGVSCDLLGLVSITQPRTIPAGASSADFTVEVIGLPLLGSLLSFTGDLGVYGADHAVLAIHGIGN